MSNRAIIAKEGQPSWIDLLKRQVGSLKYGVVQIVVHDCRVVQIERTEKFRLESERAEQQTTPAGES